MFVSSRWHAARTGGPAVHLQATNGKHLFDVILEYEGEVDVKDVVSKVQQNKYTELPAPFCSKTPVEAGYQSRTWYLEVQLGKKTFRSPETYGPTDVWEKMYEFYKYYYWCNSNLLPMDV